MALWCQRLPTSGQKTVVRKDVKCVAKSAGPAAGHLPESLSPCQRFAVVRFCGASYILSRRVER
jgi:hypothetical protein